jgi:hypothetical protein
VVQQHGIVISVGDWDTIPPPQAVHIEQAILEHLWYRAGTHPLDPLPRGEFRVERTPVVVARLTHVLEGHHKGEVYSWREPNTGDAVSSGLDVDGESLGVEDELVVEPIKL